MKTPRGIANNNPGNIRKTAIQWQGETLDDPAFETFISPEYGIRAMWKCLRTYERNWGPQTVAEIIGRWAPPVENDTGAYVRSVCAYTGFEPEHRVDLTNKGHCIVLAQAIIRHENGQQPYGSAIFERAWDRLNEK